MKKEYFAYTKSIWYEWQWNCFDCWKANMGSQRYIDWMQRNFSGKNPNTGRHKHTHFIWIYKENRIEIGYKSGYTLQEWIAKQFQLHTGTNSQIKPSNSNENNSDSGSNSNSSKSDQSISDSGSNSNEIKPNQNNSKPVGDLNGNSNKTVDKPTDQKTTNSTTDSNKPAHLPAQNIPLPTNTNNRAIMDAPAFAGLMAANIRKIFAGNPLELAPFIAQIEYLEELASSQWLLQRH